MQSTILEVNKFFNHLSISLSPDIPESLSLLHTIPSKVSLNKPQPNLVWLATVHLALIVQRHDFLPSPPRQLASSKSNRSLMNVVSANSDVDESGHRQKPSLQLNLSLSPLILPVMIFTTQLFSLILLSLISWVCGN